MGGWQEIRAGAWTAPRLRRSARYGEVEGVDQGGLEARTIARSKGWATVDVPSGDAGTRVEPRVRRNIRKAGA